LRFHGVDVRNGGEVAEIDSTAFMLSCLGGFGFVGWTGNPLNDASGVESKRPFASTKAWGKPVI
jgi:hypothetical protein